MEQGDLHREGQVALQFEVARRSPEDEAAGKRPQVQVACEVRLLHRGGQVREGPEGQQKLDALDAAAAVPEQFLAPGREALHRPEAEGLLFPVRQDAQAGARGVGGGVGGDAVNLGEQAPEQGQPLFGRSLGQTFPEGPGRALLAGPEQGPADAALVVLGAAQGEGEEEDVPFVRQFAGVSGERGRPVRIVLQFAPPDLGRRQALPEFHRLLEDFPSDQGQSGPQLMGLLVFADVPAPVIAARLGEGIERAVGFDAEAWRRHEFGVSGDWIAAFATILVGIREQALPASERGHRLRLPRK